MSGIKIHWHHMAALAQAAGGKGRPQDVLPQLFPGARYIHLARRNHRAQAISWYRAQVTNEWYRIVGQARSDLTGIEPKFDPGAVRRMELELAAQDQKWTEFFSLQPTPPLEMEYEKIAAHYRCEIARALTFLGQDPALAQKIPEPRLVCQSDAMTDEWHREMDQLFPLW